MKRAAIGLLLMAVISLGTFNVTAQAPTEKRKSFLSVLKEGQSVTLKDAAGRYEISTIEGSDFAGHKVTEIGADYLVIQDISGINEFHIPVFSIKSINQLKLPRK